MPTVGDIVTSTITELSQSPGTSTQIYATPRITQYVQDAFDFCFEATWWNAYTGWATGTLDGTTGRLTTDIPLTGLPSTIAFITRYIDIGDTFVGGSNQLIRELPKALNPDTITASTGATPIYKSPDMTNPESPIRFFPTNATGTVSMFVRQNPLHPFALTDLVYLDPLMLSLGAAYMYAADDGTNPGQINKYQSMFMKRLNDMISGEGDVALVLDPRSGTGMNEWWERG